MRTFGLIGYPLKHSFSREYFSKKFKDTKITNAEYFNYEISSPTQIHDLLKSNPRIVGLNITIPYKEYILTIIDELHEDAQKIRAVNCLKISGKEPTLRIKGFNTDGPAFLKSIQPHLNPQHKKALILGSGGSSKAVAWALKKLGIEYLFVSRNPHDCKHIRYQIVHKEMLMEHLLIINTTPLGMMPDIDRAPDLPWEHITPYHFCYDLVYNPEVTRFMQNAKARGAEVKNGLEMLHFQAELSWKIWNDDSL
ncbi:MAG: shikimate dehydrogenase [Bacteroidales bacterium]|nr:shikimate dehydrogenase [Bacteroidales bacterium]